MTILAFKGLNELLAMRVIEDRSPGGAIYVAVRLVFKRNQGVGIDHALGIHRYLAHDTSLTNLTCKIHARTARVEHEQGFGTGCLQGRNFGREVQLSKRRVYLVYDLALEVAFDPIEFIFACLIGRGHEVSILMANV